MKNYAAIGVCPVCSQGRRIIARETSSERLYVMCEECESEWPSPDVSGSLDAATRDVYGASTLLEREDLALHPWREFLW